MCYKLYTEAKNIVLNLIFLLLRPFQVFPTAMSLLASFMSGITILGNPSEVYNYGTMFWWSGTFSFNNFIYKKISISHKLYTDCFGTQVAYSITMMPDEN